MKTWSRKYLAAKCSSLARYVILDNNSCESRLQVEPLKLGRCSNGYVGWANKDVQTGGAWLV